MSNNFQPGTNGADVDRTVEDSTEQRPCPGCGEDAGNCVCGEEPWDYTENMSQNQQRGRSTGQHEQREQQATLYGWCPTDRAEIDFHPLPAPARIEITAESAQLLQGAVDSFFEHYDRIEIIAPGEWRAQLEAEIEQAAEDHEEAAKEFWADLEIEGSGL